MHGVPEEVKISEALSKIRHKCKCGHTVFIPNKVDFVYCDYCFRRVYKNDFSKFKRELLKAMGCGINEQISQ